MKLLRRVPYYACLVLLAYMPFHVFLSQSLSLATGGLDAWKIGKDVLLTVVVLFTICLVWQQRRFTKLFAWLVGLGALYLALHFVVWLMNPDIYRTSAMLGTAYNVRLPAFLVLGYGATLLYSSKTVWRTAVKVLLVASTLVAVIGIIQYFLPKDILSHVGYSLDRGARPAFFIDDNPAFPRIMSTLREPNTLGAYLILPLALLTALLLRTPHLKQRLGLATVWLAHLAALVLTFSRSAWLGAALAVCLVLWWRYRSVVGPVVKRWWPLLATASVLLVVLIVTQRDSQLARTYITHAPPETVEDLDSNDYHWLLIREGLVGVVDQPLGHGPGTAGIVSIQNPESTLLTENYYIQVAYEVGVIGLAALVTISVVVYVALLRRRDMIAAVLLASFWGYVLMNMLLHTWSNEAVAAQWWVAAGLALSVDGAVFVRKP